MRIRILFFLINCILKKLPKPDFFKRKRHQCRHDCHLTQHSKHAENHRVKHYKAWGIIHFYIFGFLHNTTKLLGRLKPPPSPPPIPPFPYCAFSQNFNTKKLGEILVFYAVTIVNRNSLSRWTKKLLMKFIVAFFNV